MKEKIILICGHLLNLRHLRAKKNQAIMNEHPRIEIMDTTLRDGEQTSGVSFVPHEKLMIARLLLEDLKVDRIEVASARVSEGEFDAVRMICDWAARRGLLSHVEVLGFVDGQCWGLSMGIRRSIGYTMPDAASSTSWRRARRSIAPGS